MALFSKHCSSHYHHHMLQALSSLISASAHCRLGRDREGALGERGCHEKGSRDTEKCVQPILFQHRSHIFESFSRGLTIKQIGMWCRENRIIEKSVMENGGGEMIAGRIAYLPLIVPSLSRWKHNDFRCTLLWLEPSVIPSSFWSAIDFYCSCSFFSSLIYSQQSVSSRVVLAQDKSLTWVSQDVVKASHWINSKISLWYQ